MEEAAACVPTIGRVSMELASWPVSRIVLERNVVSMAAEVFVGPALPGKSALLIFSVKSKDVNQRAETMSAVRTAAVVFADFALGIKSAWMGRVLTRSMAVVLCRSAVVKAVLVRHVFARH